LDKFFLNKDIGTFMPEVTVQEEAYGAVYRAQQLYFKDRFGALPVEERVVYPSRLAPVVNKAVVRFLDKYEFKPYVLTRLPILKRLEAGSYFAGGNWINPEGSIIFSVEDYGIERGVSYEIVTKSDEETKAALKEFTQMVNRQFKNKVLALHDEVKILTGREIAALAPDWQEVRGTLEPAIATRTEEVVLPFFDRVEAYRQAGIAPRLGILMHGGTGTGKTYLLKALIKRFAGRATIAHVSADQFYRQGASIRSLFSFLQEFAPLVLIIEDIELLARNREALLDNPTVQALLDILDGAVVPLDRVMVVATTNVIDQLDPAFKRPGRFDEVWQFEAPSPEQAAPAFNSYMAKSGLEYDSDLVKAAGDAGLSYAELRFVATECLRRAIAQGKQRVEVGKEELKDIMKAATSGVQKRRAIGFKPYGGSPPSYDDIQEAIEAAELGIPT